MGLCRALVDVDRRLVLQDGLEWHSKLSDGLAVLDRLQIPLRRFVQVVAGAQMDVSGWLTPAGMLGILITTLVLLPAGNSVAVPFCPELFCASSLTPTASSRANAVLENTPASINIPIVVLYIIYSL